MRFYLQCIGNNQAGKYQGMAANWLLNPFDGVHDDLFWRGGDGSRTNDPWAGLKAIKLIQPWGKIFSQSSKIEHHKVVRLSQYWYGFSSYCGGWVLSPAV